MDSPVRLVNLTGHSIVLEGTWADVRLAASGKARADTRMYMADRVRVMGRNIATNQAEDFFVPLLQATEQAVVGLPDPRENTLYIVSGIVASLARGRDDVVTPSRINRDGRHGRIESARALLRVSKGDEGGDS